MLVPQIDYTLEAVVLTLKHAFWPPVEKNLGIFGLIREIGRAFENNLCLVVTHNLSYMNIFKVENENVTFLLSI